LPIVPATLLGEAEIYPSHNVIARVSTKTQGWRRAIRHAIPRACHHRRDRRAAGTAAITREPGRNLIS